MSRTIQFQGEPRESINGSSVQRSHPQKEKAPKFVACLLLLPEDAEQILKLFQKLAARDPELSPSVATADVEEPNVSADVDHWLGTWRLPHTLEYRPAPSITIPARSKSSAANLADGSNTAARCSINSKRLTPYQLAQLQPQRV